MTDKNKTTDQQPLTPDETVDIDHIKELMGPFPDEAGQPPVSDKAELHKQKGKTKTNNNHEADDKPAKKIVVQSEAADDSGAESDDSVENEDVADSLEAFNNSLRASMPGLGNAAIERVTDNDEANLPKITGDQADDPESTTRTLATTATPEAATEVDYLAHDPDNDDEPHDTAEPSGAPEVTTPLPIGVTSSKAPAPAGPYRPKLVADTPIDSSLADSSVQGSPEADATPDDYLKELTKNFANHSEAADPALDKVVDDIVASETDQLLKMEDEKLSAADEASPKKDKKKGIWLGDIWRALWRRTGVRWLLVYLILATIAALAVIPFTRYFILNTAGVRVSSNVTVLDLQTEQPLKNVKVKIAGTAATTDKDGKATLEHLKLGPANLTIEKSAFGTVTQKLVLGWGSNPLGSVKLSPTGTQFKLNVVDFLSNKPIDKVEATSGDGSAMSDKDGNIILTLDAKADAEATITLSSSATRTEVIAATASATQTKVIKLVPSRKHVFVSRRSGKYDVYSVDADGKNVAKIVAGSGLERDDIALIPHPTAPAAVLVSTRENVRNSDGYLLSTLYNVDINTGTLTKIDQSERIQVVGWTADQHVVFVKIVAGTSASNPKRQRMLSYNAKTSGDVKELASSNSFNDVMMVDDKIYYSPSSAFLPADQNGLFKVAADGSNKSTLFDKEVWNIFRTDFNGLALSVGQDWYTYKLGGSEVTKASAPPASLKSRLYIPNDAKKQAAWVDSRDGKGVLLSFDTATQKDTALVSKAGVKLPAYWLNDHYLIYRVNNGQETADYVLNTEGGQPAKIADVSDTGGVESWYYY